MHDDESPAPNAALVRQGYGETTMVTGNEMQAQALAAQVKAAVEARYILALRRPRNLAAVRTKLLDECRRPRFADEARYSVPRGRKKNEQTGEWEDNMVEGPSIRFAEAATRCMTNLDTTAMTVYDDPSSRSVRITVIDLESNNTYSKDVTIAKTMERRKLRQGQNAIGERYTSTGERVFIVEVPDSELTNIQAAAESKAIRTLTLRHVPGDIVDECMEVCVATLKNEHAKDPQAANKKLFDGFARLGIHGDQLEAYLGHPLAQMSPAEYQHLRSLGIALRDGQIQWAEALAAKLEGRAVEVPAPAAPAPAAVEPPAAGHSGPGIEPGTIDVPAGATALADAATQQAAAKPSAPTGKAKGAKAAAAALKAAQAPLAAAAPPSQHSPAPAAAPPPSSVTPGPGSAAWERAKEAAQRAEIKPQAPDPHGDPPPPDDVQLPGGDDHAAGDPPDWMR